MTNTTSFSLSEKTLTFIDDVVADNDTRLRSRSHALDFTMRRIEESKEIQELIYEKVIGGQKKR